MRRLGFNEPAESSWSVAQARDEPFRTVPPATDRDIARHGCGGARRYCRLSAPPGRSAASGRLPHHPGHGDTIRRKSRDNGVLGRRPAGASAWAIGRCDGDDLIQRAWGDLDHDSIRSWPQYRFGGAGRTGGDQRRGQDLATVDDDTAKLTETHSGRDPTPQPSA